MKIVARQKKRTSPAIEQAVQQEQERLAGPRVLLEHERVTVHHGDCLKVMASMPEASVDTIVTDPPYGLEFMGKEWDHGLPGVPFWRAALRVAKPGAMLLAFGGTRTFHRLACAIEDAGWEIRDTMTMFYCYGSGFPKSYNIGIAFEHKLCERVTVCVDGQDVKRWHYKDDGEPIRKEPPFRDPNANTWWGYGTALKPAYEIILCAMKPLDGSEFCANALAHGVAGLNVDGGRVGTETIRTSGKWSMRNDKQSYSPAQTNYQGSEHQGRWPANLVLSHDPRCIQVGTEPAPGYAINRFKDGAKPFGDGAGHEYESEQVSGGEQEVWACVPSCAVRILDSQSGQSKSPTSHPRSPDGSAKATWSLGRTGGVQVGHGDSGGASRYFKTFAPDVTPSRFFYTAKSSTTERVLGCPPGYQNRHPTVKPLDLCRYLCRLTRTPTGGVVLDPFSGSGSIAVGALLEGRTAIAIELEEESANATVARVQAALKYGDKLQGLKKFKLEGRKKLKRRR